MSAGGGDRRSGGDLPRALPDWGVREFQRRIEEVYGARDAARGVPSTFTWLVEEVGELARSLLSGEPGSDAEAREFADVLAWLATLASLRGVDLAAAAREKYGAGCPRCGAVPCRCSHRG
jgi:NTP pyrophosphatase (non-canonical NTP hydrolase)